MVKQRLTETDALDKLLTFSNGGTPPTKSNVRQFWWLLVVSTMMAVVRHMTAATIFTLLGKAQLCSFVVYIATE
ncbi:hypothetical protein A2U01_0038868 [Trifolium medium]|uniref:Uncharacterized protein n=1 Tax=Trifolium medium TaxID=97028 RepID=A0A392Q0W8_9FABA|nr:hypothetical protein [Trifolium medium]